MRILYCLAISIFQRQWAAGAALFPTATFVSAPAPVISTPPPTTAPWTPPNSTPQCRVPKTVEQDWNVQGAISIIELFVAVLSCVGTFFHFKDSGRFGGATVFHMAHAGFSISYAGYHFGLLYVQSPLMDPPLLICECDASNIMYAVYMWFYAIMWDFFLRYWNRMTLAANQAPDNWRCRALMTNTFSLIIFVLQCRALAPSFIDNPHYKQHCKLGRFMKLDDTDLYYWPFSVFGILYLLFESLILAKRCYDRMRQAEIEKAKRSQKAIVQTLMFASLPVSMVLALILAVVGNGFANSTSLFFFFIPPSSVMLYLMWQRRYITLSNGFGGLGDQTFSWHSTQGGSFGSPNISMAENLFAASDQSLHAPLLTSEWIEAGLNPGQIAERVHEVDQARAALYARDIRTELGVPAAPLFSDLTLTLAPSSSCDTSRRKSDDGDRKKSYEGHTIFLDGKSASAPAAPSLSPTSPILGPRTAGVEVPLVVALEVAESLSPPTCLFALTRLFLTNLALPALERAYAEHNKNSSALLRAANQQPDDENNTGFDLGNMAGSAEQARQLLALEEECTALTESFAAFLMLVRAQAAHLPECDGAATTGPGYAQFAMPALVVKPGKASFTPGVRVLFKNSTKKKVPTLSHVTTNLQVHATSLRHHEGDSGLITSVTFGAPSAHSLGWKFGGLREVAMKLELFTRKGFVVGADMTRTQRSTKTGLRNLELAFEVHARETVVLSQALGGAVAASIDLLTAAIGKRDELLLRQFHEIGLLLHSVCLLSTTGHELMMIDDFAGAYERLNLTLRLECSESVGTGAKKGLALLQVAQVIPASNAAGGKSKHCNIGAVIVVLNVTRRLDFEWIMGIVGSKILASSPGVVAGSSVDIIVIPVLFNLGVNEMQTAANTGVVGTTNVQTKINRYGLETLTGYFDKLHEFYTSLNAAQTPADGAGDTGHGCPSQYVMERPSEVMIEDKLADLEKIKKLLDELHRLIELEHDKKAKHVQLLLDACRIGRLLNGARTTSCKSAKDRTSIFHTLEVARLAEDWDWLDSSQEPVVLEELRGCGGVRLRNCELNIGRAMYSFNALQLRALPPELRPPSSTCTGGKD